MRNHTDLVRKDSLVRGSRWRSLQCQLQPVIQCHLRLDNRRLDRSWKHLASKNWGMMDLMLDSQPVRQPIQLSSTLERRSNRSYHQVQPRRLEFAWSLG